MKLTNSGLIATAIHAAVMMTSTVAITVLAWHGVVQGSAALVSILALAGVNVAGQHGINSALRAPTQPGQG